MQRNWKSYTFLVGMLNGTDPVESSLVLPQKVQHKITKWAHQYNSSVYNHKIQKEVLKYLNTHVRKSTTDNNQMMERTERSIQGRMGIKI